jgi:hypothetical protein
VGFALAAQAIVQILLPAYLIWDLYRTKEFTKTGRHLLVVITALSLAFIFFIARWDITSVYLRWLLPLGFLVAAGRIYQRPVTGKQKSRVAFLWIWAVLGCLLIGYVIWAKVLPGGAVDLSSPLKDGPYYVAHGGNATLLNYHHRSRSQAYALDIAQLSDIGHDDSFSKDLDDYEIYGDPVYSPCSGRVFEAVSHLDNLIPPETDRDNLAGNHVIVDCEQENVRVVMAHLQKDSLKVNKGELISEGDPVGNAGNSGNTTQPHLHIHAVAAGEDILKGRGVPITLDGRFPTRNSLIG